MIPRLYTTAHLVSDGTCMLSKEQAHYLKNVLRREPGSEIRLFNSNDGEFAATIAALSKAGATANVGACTRLPGHEPDLTLAFAPIKRGPTEFLIQKCVELGVAAFVPVLTARTNNERLRTDRLAAIAREAAEQCGRLSVPRIDEPIKLSSFIQRHGDAGALIFCDEAGDDPSALWGGDHGRAAPMLDVLNGHDRLSRATILIGPEGGFAPDERAMLRGVPNVLPVTLGPRILRADTAAIAAVTLWQAALGDLAKT